MTPLVLYQSNSTITCNYTFNDADNDSEKTASLDVQWYIDSVHNSSFDDEVTINPENITIGSTIQCRVKVFDDVFETGNETWSALSIGKTLSGYEPAILIFGSLGVILGLLFYFSKNLDEKHFATRTFFHVASPFILMVVIAILTQLSVYNGASEGIISLLNTAFFVVLGVSIFNTGYFIFMTAKRGMEYAVDKKWA
jgi:hypothetical protein